MCDDRRRCCATEVSQDIGRMAAKREIYSCRICPLADGVRLARDWIMLSDALTAVQSYLPFVVLVQACLLYDSLPFGGA